MSERRIKVNYVARVEGEAKLDVKVSNGEINELILNVWEPPRFFEGFLVGRKFSEVPDLVARICGICPVSHMTTALRAIESAMGINPSQQTKELRRLMALSQIVASHMMHLYMLSAPDYMGYDGIVEMLKEHPSLIKRVLKMKGIMNRLTAIVGGRSLHPMTPVVNGFTRVPGREELEDALKGLKAIKEDAVETARFISSLSLPNFERETEYVALRRPNEYPVNEGRLVSSGGLEISERDYYDYIMEKQVPYSNAKHCTVKGRGAFMVGALSRVNLNFEFLSSDTKEIANDIGFKVPSYNPFTVNIAQALEIINGVDECISIIEKLHPRKEDRSFRVKAGIGVSLTEAPRGILCHSYRINSEGVVEWADIRTPTAHNVFNIEKDLWQMLPEILHRSLDEITLQCEALIRSYDPCFSCSVHFLKLNIEDIR